MMNFLVKLLVALVGVWMAFLLGRMLVKGATSGGITRSGEPMAYWSFALLRTAFIAFLVYVLIRGRI
jgi:hypothetical protein